MAVEFPKHRRSQIGKMKNIMQIESIHFPTDSGCHLSNSYKRHIGTFLRHFQKSSNVLPRFGKADIQHQSAKSPNPQIRAKRFPLGAIYHSVRLQIVKKRIERKSDHGVRATGDFIIFFRFALGIIGVVNKAVRLCRRCGVKPGNQFILGIERIKSFGKSIVNEHHRLGIRASSFGDGNQKTDLGADEKNNRRI